MTLPKQVKELASESAVAALVVAGEKMLRGAPSQWLKKLRSMLAWRRCIAQPRAGERLDRIKTPADLAPDESKKLSGSVLDVDSEPVEGAKVFLLPAEHINGVYLRDGRIRNPLEEHLTRTNSDGRFVIYPEEGEKLIAAAHPQGFAIAKLDDSRTTLRLALKPWARVFGHRPIDGADAQQEVNFTCYPVAGISFHIYEIEIAKDGSFDQGRVPPGKVFVSRSLSTGNGASMSFPVEELVLAAGESHEVALGPIPEAVKSAINNFQKREDR